MAIGSPESSKVLKADSFALCMAIGASLLLGAGVALAPTLVVLGIVFMAAVVYGPVSLVTGVILGSVAFEGAFLWLGPWVAYGFREGIFVTLTIAAGLSLLGRFLDGRRKLSPPLRILVAAGLGPVLWSLLPLAKSPDLLTGLVGFRNITLYLFAVVVAFVAASSRPGLGRAAILGMAVGSALSTLVALIQHIAPRESMDLLGHRFGDVEFRTFQGFVKAPGLMDSAASMGWLSAAAALVGFALLLRGRPSPLGFSLTLFGTIGLVASFSRTAWIAWFVATVLALFELSKGTSSRTTRISILAVCLAVMGVISRQLYGDLSASYLISAFGLGETTEGWKSVLVRLDIWKTLMGSLDPISFIFGSGLGTTGAASQSRILGDVAAYRVVDSFVVKLAVEGGILTLLLHGIAMIALLRIAGKVPKGLHRLPADPLALGARLVLIMTVIFSLATSVMEVPSIAIIFGIVVGGCLGETWRSATFIGHLENAV